MQTYEGRIAPPGEGKIAIVVSKFNQTITQSMLDGCLAKLRQNGVRENDLVVAWVPGAFELPTIAGIFANDEDFQAVICLGCVIKGETPHDVYIAQSVSAELARLGVETGIPVIFGVLTCNTNAQALARAGLGGNVAGEGTAAEGSVADGAAGEAADETSRDKILGETTGNKGVEAAEAALEMLDLLIQLPEPSEEESEPDRENIFYHAKRYQNGDFDADDADDDFEEEDEDDERPPKFGPRHAGPKEFAPKRSNGNNGGGYGGGNNGSSNNGGGYHKGFGKGKPGSSFGGKKPGHAGPSGFKGSGKKGKPGGGKRHGNS